jgi:hypothetical protein
MLKTKEMAMQQREADSNEIQYKPITTGVQMPRKILDMGKKEIIAHAKDIYNAMMDGNLDPIETMIEVKKGILFFETLDENVRPVIYGKTIVGRGDILKMHNVEIEPSELGVKWNFDVCNDNILTRLINALEAAKTAVTDRQNFLKVITTQTDVVDEETGEVYRVNPPVRTSLNGYKFSVKN